MYIIPKYLIDILLVDNLNLELFPLSHIEESFLVLSDEDHICWVSWDVQEHT